MKQFVFFLMWSLIRLFDLSKSQALTLAWMNEKNRRALLAGPHVFYFVKLDGEIRRAYGTLRPADIPELAQSKGKRTSSPKVQVFFDLEKMDWRCYRKDCLIK